ncbi:MAG: T9SS type A sorting domain-containing protein [Bacteroidota bacterium]
MKYFILVLAALLLVSTISVGQQVQLTRLVTIAGDSTVKLQCRSVEYLPSGVIWLQAGDIPYTGKNMIYLSTDHGTSWVKRDVYTNAALSSPGIANVSAKDANTAIIATTTGEIMRTTNGGVKWDTVSSYATPDVAFCDGVKFLGQDTVIAYGDAVDTGGVFVSRSTDAGATWTRFGTWQHDSLRLSGVYAGSVTYGQAMDVYGKNAWLTLYNTANDPPSILKSTDGGTSWSWFRVTLPSGPATNYIFLSITFKDANIGYAVGRRAYSTSINFSNYLCKTTDGGLTWSDTISVEPGVGHVNAKPMTVRAIRGTNTVIAVGFGTTGAKAWISTDQGGTWSNMNAPTPGLTSADLRNSAFISATQGILIGSQNLVLIKAATGVELEQSTPPTAYTLNQNYPNPFNPSTTISYSLPQSGFVDLTVSDLLGRVVVVLVQGQQSAGTHVATFDGKGLSSGMYLYTLRAGDFTATKSLLLVK